MKKPKTPEEKVAFIAKWSNWFYEHTESFDYNSLGTELSYLYPAICKDHKIELYHHSELVNILNDYKVCKNDEIWDYIEVVN